MLENQWEMILRGLEITIIISVSAGILGFILGAFLCVIRRTQKIFLSLIGEIYIRIMQGIPVVLLLMMLSYIFLVGVNSILIAIVGFAMYFAAQISNCMCDALDALDRRQIEASYALGFNKRKAFFAIFLPQTVPQFFPLFQREFISMMKMTSIVGYIAIDDLTKMSDLIRSRTYDAFLPLILTAGIYFLLTWIFIGLLSIVKFKINPENKKRIIKGVVEK